MPKMPDLAAGSIRLCLFVANETPRSVIAIENIRRALVEFVDAGFLLEVINVFDDPDRALSERVLITPTLLAPGTARRIVGDLSEQSQLHYFLHGLSGA